jgi:hypothetical protein
MPRSGSTGSAADRTHKPHGHACDLQLCRRPETFPTAGLSEAGPSQAQIDELRAKSPHSHGGITMSRPNLRAGEPMRSSLAVLLLVAVSTVGCASSSPAGSSFRTPDTSSASSPTTAPVAALVGRWQRITSCPELVNDLKRSGLAPLAPYAWIGQTSSTGQGSFAAGSPKPTMANPCTGALTRQHSHFFNQSGQFGSLDWLGGQVDDGSYRIVNGSTLRIGHVAFHYSISNGDTLSLYPVLSQSMIRQALAHPQKFSDAGWAVSVAYPAQTWKRVPCEIWC